MFIDKIFRSSNEEEQKPLKKTPRELRNYNTIEEKIVRVLLLGSGDAGKSTIMRHIKMILTDEINYDSISVNDIRRFIINSIMQIVSSASAMDEKFIESENRDFATWLLDQEENVLWTSELAMKIKTLWQDDTTRKLVEHRGNEIQIDDSAFYFFEHIERVTKIDYELTKEDILRTRIKTTGVVQVPLEVDDVKVCIIDIGGQRRNGNKYSIMCTSSYMWLQYLNMIKDVTKRKTLIV
jgi:energy-coupling factor transporter ATP-binding protein EcfA2